MKKDVRAIEHIWREEGYIIVKHSETRRKSVLTSLDIVIRRADGQPISFKDEWAKIERAAYRKSFFVVPIIDALGCNMDFERVVLIRKKGIIKAHQYWEELNSALIHSYWMIQGDKDVLEFVRQSNNIKEGIMAIWNRIELMYDTDYASRLYDDWIYYKRDVLDFYEDIKESEKIDGQSRMLAEKIKNLYFE